MEPLVKTSFTLLETKKSKQSKYTQRQVNNQPRFYYWLEKHYSSDMPFHFAVQKYIFLRVSLVESQQSVYATSFLEAFFS